MSLETLCRLCQVFHISVDRLLFSQLSSSRMQNLSQQIAALSFSSREQEKSFYDAVSALILGMDAFLP